MENPLIFYFVLLFLVSGISTLMSISDELHPSFFRRWMEKMRSMNEEMDGKVFISRQGRHFAFVNIMVEILFPICTLTWRVNIYVCRQGKGINRRDLCTSINNSCIVEAFFGLCNSVNYRLLETIVPSKKENYNLSRPRINSGNEK